MAYGKIDPKIAAAAEDVVERMRDELKLAVNAIVQTIAKELIPLQQDVEKLKQDVLNLERERDTPTICDGQAEQKPTN